MKIWIPMVKLAGLKWDVSIDGGGKVYVQDKKPLAHPTRSGCTAGWIVVEGEQEVVMHGPEKEKVIL